ncbi:MAG: hypothetical protein U0470_00560 [Anaerolineae bacterium]
MYWLADRYPAESIGLRGSGTLTPWRSCAPTRTPAARAGDGDAVRADARADVLGTVDRGRAPLVVHEGAVYLHDGMPWRVEALDWEAGRAFVSPADGATYTRASARVEVEPIATAAERDDGPCRVGYGELEVRSKPTSYRELRFSTNETIRWGTIDLPEAVHVAGGYWFTLDDACVERLRDRPLGLRPDGRPRPELARAARRRPGPRREPLPPVRLGRAARPDARRPPPAPVPHVRLAQGRERPLPRGERPGQPDHALPRLPPPGRARPRPARRARRRRLRAGPHRPAAPDVRRRRPGRRPPPTRRGPSARRWWCTSRRAAASASAKRSGAGTAELLRLCDELVRGCDCAWGCPSCVGPGSPAGRRRVHARAVLGVLTGLG